MKAATGHTGQDEGGRAGMQKPAVLQERHSNSNTPKEDASRQLGQWRYLVSGIRREFPAPKGGRRRLAEHLRLDFLFKCSQLYCAWHRSCPRCSGAHAEHSYVTPQPDSPNDVIYVTVEGRIQVPVPDHRCTSCGVERRVYPVTAGAPPALPSEPAVFFSISLLALTENRPALMPVEAWLGVLQQVHLKNGCAEGEGSVVLRNLGLAADQWSCIGEHATEFRFAADPVDPSMVAEDEAAAQRANNQDER